MNYFIEGLQGSGKSTFVEKIAGRYPEYTAIHEGDYSPIELAWCAYVSREEYCKILDKYKDIRSFIEEKSHAEKDRMVICYTQIITDIPGFHKDLEQYEIYNNRVSYDEFKRIVLSRFCSWSGGNRIFECSLFQNIVEDLILFRNASDQEIIRFYKEIRDVLGNKDFHIIYLQTADIAESVGIIRKERSDGQGNELWFQMMTEYLQNSPCGKAHALEGIEGLIWHLEQRRRLEHCIIEEVFKENSVRLKAKSDSVKEFIKKC